MHCINKEIFVPDMLFDIGVYFAGILYSIVNLKQTRQGRERKRKGSNRMKKRHILGLFAAALIGLSSVAQPTALTVNAQELVPLTANETGISILEFTSPEFKIPQLGEPMMDNFMVSSKDGKTRVDHMQDDIFLSWWKKQPDGSWRYASNDRVFTEGEYRLRFETQGLETADGYMFLENTQPAIRVNGNDFSVVTNDGIIDSYWVRDHEHSGTFAVYSEVYRVNAAGQPDAAQNVTLRFIQTDALNMGFVGSYTGEFPVARDKTLAEQGISFPRVGNELTAGQGYKPVFKYKGAVITDLNFKIDADAEIRVEAVKEGTTDPDEVYYAFYEFESVTKGKNLPQEVVETLPEDDTEYQNGDVVHAILPNPTEVAVADGTWVFKGYDVTPQMVHVDDVTFRGKWVFTTKAATINQVPTIKAGNRVLTVGDAFDPLEGVTAEDAEEGTIPMTEKNIKEQNVDRTTAGEYFVVFVVSDKQGAMTEKRIEVTVKEKEDAGQENPKPNDPPTENPKPNDPPAENPKPNDPPAENPKPNKPSEEKPMPGRPQAEKPNNSQMNQPSQNGTSKQESQAGKTEKNEVRKQEQVKQDSASSAVKTPKTGDRMPIGLLAGAAIISIISLTVILVRKSVKNKSK